MRCTCFARRWSPSLLDNDVDDPSSLVDSWKGWRGNPMAKSALELAVWDCHARQLDVPLRTLLGGERTEIPVGASLGMNPFAETVAVGRTATSTRATSGSS